MKRVLIGRYGSRDRVMTSRVWAMNPNLMQYFLQGVEEFSHDVSSRPEMLQYLQAVRVANLTQDGSRMTVDPVPDWTPSSHNRKFRSPSRCTDFAIPQIQSCRWPAAFPGAAQWACKSRKGPSSSGRDCNVKYHRTPCKNICCMNESIWLSN